VPTRSPWLDAPYQPRPALDGDLTVDVAVVGAGVGGLSVSWHLLERGITPALLEAGTVAGGASGRNGGFLAAGGAMPYDELRTTIGAERARWQYAATGAAIDTIAALAAEAGAADAVRRTGSMHQAADEAEETSVRAQVAALMADGFEAELVERADLPPSLRGAGGAAAFMPRDAAVHPARWLRALAVMAAARRLRIHENTPVEPPARDGDGLILRTPRGTVRASAVVVAADNAGPALVPVLAGSVTGRRLHMVATAGAVAPVLPLPVSWRRTYEYAQQVPDGRVLIGGFSDLDGERSYTDRDEGDPAVHARIELDLHERLGVDAPIGHRWVGLVGFTENRLPRVGAVPGEDGLFALGGYSGSGNLNGWVAGSIVAAMVAGEEPEGEPLYPAPGA
jgi:glycine/D-amino acid oxidase-like deaminating enzyme